MLPILIVEDMELSINRLKLLFEEISGSLGVQVKLDFAVQYEDSVEKATSGKYPLAIIDLNLPNPLADAETPLNEFLGLEIIASVRKHNKDTVIGVYSGYASQNVSNLISMSVNGLLSKTEDDVSLRDNLSSLISEATKRFNYTIDTKVDEVLNLAFDGSPPWGERKHWEICLRRFLRAAQETISYNSVGKGPRGAGIVAAYVDSYPPKILRCNLYDRLREELDRYDEFIKDYIPNCALTSVDELSQSGDVGILAYSFAGLGSIPVTLSQATNEYSPEDIVSALSNHFRTNCERWFVQKGAPKPYDLHSLCREHLGLDPEYIHSLLSEEKVNVAVDRSAAYLGVEPHQLVNTLTDSIRGERRKIRCSSKAIIHGGLTSNNLIWEGENLWMIDFTKTGLGPRILDFADLEASLKFDTPTVFGTEIPDEGKVGETLAFEDTLLNVARPDKNGKRSNFSSGLVRKFAVINSIRSLALEQCGSQPEFEYCLVLFWVTVKHIQRLSEDVLKGEDTHIMLVHALTSAYRLASMLDSKTQIPLLFEFDLNITQRWVSRLPKPPAAEFFHSQKIPYFFGPPVSDPLRFFGRRDEIEEIFQLLKQSEHGNFWPIAVVGDHRLGKSSLLKILDKRIPIETKCLSTYIDIASIGEEQFFQTIVRRVAECIYSKSPERHSLRSIKKAWDLKEWRNFFGEVGIDIMGFLKVNRRASSERDWEDFGDILGKIRKRLDDYGDYSSVVIILDEVSACARWDGCSELLKIWRSYVQSLHGYNFLVADAHPLYQLSQDKWSAFSMCLELSCWAL